MNNESLKKMKTRQLLTLWSIATAAMMLISCCTQDEWQGVPDGDGNKATTSITLEKRKQSVTNTFTVYLLRSAFIYFLRNGFLLKLAIGL